MWRKRVSQARARYVFKTDICKLLLAQRINTFPAPRPSDPEWTRAYNQILRRESEAREEFIRALGIYTALVTKGTLPPYGEE